MISFAPQTTNILIMKKIYFLFAMLCCAFLGTAQKQMNARLTKISHSYGEQEKLTTVQGIMDASLFPFYHGVASGDPTSNSIIIWTRVTPYNDEEVTVSWKMATDPQLQHVVQQGNFQTGDFRDYTVKVDVTGLNPGTTYYYSFTALGKQSITGRTRTVPTTSVSQLRFAVASCSNYQNGFFNVYDRLAERNDIDAVIHLGDYIYEYEEGGFGYSSAVGRGHEPTNEIITLDDYRVRHSFYKLDPSLRRAHQQHPFILIWDDHEFANDAYVNGAENHQPATEGDWNTRKNNAWKAYFEWMPIRDNVQNPNQIYRRIQYGNLMDLILLDTRIEGRDKQDDSFLFKIQNTDLSRFSQDEANKFLLKSFLEGSFKMKEGKGAISQEEFDALYAKLLVYMEASDWDAQKLEKNVSQKEWNELRAEVYSKLQRVNLQENKGNKTLLGETQFNWFTQQLSNSKAKWKVVGNQVLMMPVIPLELKDTWNGYQEERERLYTYIKDKKINNIVVITGDIHMTFVADLPKSLLTYNTLFKTGSMGVEFVAPSITSSNLDEFAGFTSSFLNWLVAAFNPHIKKADLSNHGYFILDVKNDRVQADWNYVNTIQTVNPEQFYSHSYYVRDGEKFLKNANAASTLATTNVPALAPLARTNATTETTGENAVVVIGNYPNPSKGLTNLHFAIAEPSQVMASLYNEKGILVGELFNDTVTEGLYNLEYNVSGLPTGIYLLQLRANEAVISRKIIVGQ